MGYMIAGAGILLVGVLVGAAIQAAKMNKPTDE